MAKELDENFYVGNKQCVNKIDGKSIDALMKNREQRRTYGYSIYANDNLLNGC